MFVLHHFIARFRIITIDVYEQLNNQLDLVSRLLNSYCQGIIKKIRGNVDERDNAGQDFPLLTTNYLLPTINTIYELL